MKMTNVIKKMMMVLVFVGMVSVAHGATVRISWNGNSESDLAGYKVYYGTTSGSYSKIINAGLNTSADVPALTAGVTYYFAVTAIDTSNNESGFSQEAHATIPEQLGDQGNGLPADSDLDGIPDSMEELWGLNPSNPMDSLMDSDGDGVVNLVEFMAGTSAVNAADYPNTDNVLKDIIGEVGEVIDLAEVNSGNYTIVPLTNAYPAPAQNTITINNPGAYLYNVIDGQSLLVYRLRVSVTDELSVIGAFEPGSFLDIADDVFGIRVELPEDAMIRNVPIGIGSTTAAAASAVQYKNGTFEFDILPYGLVLAKPAVITVNCDDGKPTVKRYDSANDSWVDVSNVAASDGKVSFSSDQLGTFKVVTSEAADNQVPVTDGGGSGGGGGGCFISTAGF